MNPELENINLHGMSLRIIFLVESNFLKQIILYYLVL